MAININIPSQVKTYVNLAAFPVSGSLKTIYIAEDTNKTYRWTGSAYVEISATATTSWGGITGTLSAQTDLQSALNAKQNALTLTTTGTSGAATLVGSTLNIPQYSGGGGGLQGIHNLVKLQPSLNETTSLGVNASAATTAATVANRIIALPFIPSKTFTSSFLYINVTTAVASSLCKILVYSDLDGRPDTKINESADLDCSTTGQKSASMGVSFTAGTTYWLCIHSSSTPTLSALSTAALLVIKVNATANVVSYAANVTYGFAPTTFPTTLINGVANTPSVYIQSS